MLVVCSDTHARTGHSLSPAMETAVADADRVVHAGDFVTADALDAFQSASRRLEAVHGNADQPAVRDRLPSARTVTWDGVTLAVTHRPEGGRTGLALFGRERGADVVVHGHTHRPRCLLGDGPAILNPGSHADPRGNRPGYAELHHTDGRLRIELAEPDGSVVAEHHVEL